MNQLINKECIKCGRVFTFLIPEAEINKYEAGALIQNALTSLSASERELFISGYCDECFQEIFKDVEEDELDEYLDKDSKENY